MAAKVRAEDQALIAGMRAVPKAERHRLREIPEDEAYEEWKLKLAAEPMDMARERAEAAWNAMEELLKGWQESEGFWKGQEWEDQEIYEGLKGEYEACVQEWTQRCLEWGEALEQ
jgi:ATP-binding cassette subfamily F protein 3